MNHNNQPKYFIGEKVWWRDPTERAASGVFTITDIISCDNKITSLVIWNEERGLSTRVSPNELVCPTPPVSAEVVADIFNMNADSISTIDTLIVNDHAYDLLICGIGTGAYFQWATEDGNRIGNVFDCLLENTRRQFALVHKCRQFVLTQQSEKEEQAEALGFSSVEKMVEHQCWLEQHGTPEYHAWAASIKL